MNFYISKFRYKLAFACAAGIVIMLINGWKTGISFHALIVEYGIVFLVLILMSIYLWYPAFRYIRKTPEEMWSSWGRLAKCKDRREFQDFKFDRVYRKTRYAMAKEPTKGYRTLTTLENCTCVDFRKNHAPCIHMYKLADILELYEER